MDSWVFGIFIGGFFLIFVGVFVVIFAVLARQAWKAWQTRRANAASPQQSFPVRVVAKRDQTSGGGDSAARTKYFVTFERLDHLRVEFSVSGEQYGMLAEGDQGRLTHQGTWFVDFQRDRG